MSNSPRQITIGWPRSDNDEDCLDVCMTVHLENLDEHEESAEYFDNQSPLQHFIDMARDLGCVVLEREDMPDVLDLERKE